MQTFSVLIIGAGKIGAFFDKPGSDVVLTHAHAFAQHKGFRLVGFVDTDLTQAERAASVWGGAGYPSVADAFSSQSIDVVVVAVPDSAHFQVLHLLTDYPVRFVLTEKPLAKKLDEAEQIVACCRQKNIGVMVNYTRRFVPEFREIRSQIAEGLFGKFLTGTGYYGKGIIHNGSHMIDLLQYYLGEIDSAKSFGRVNDFYEDDPSISVCFKMKQGGDFMLSALDCRAYTVFEMDLFFENKRVKITDSGFSIEKFNVINSELFAGYQTMGFEEVINTDLQKGLMHVAENIYDVLAFGDDILCTADDGLLALRACMIAKGSA